MNRNSGMKQSKGNDRGGPGEGGGKKCNSETKGQGSSRIAKRHRSSSLGVSESGSEAEEMRSEDEMSENNQAAKRFNIVVRFAEEGGVTKMNPLKLTESWKKMRRNKVCKGVK